MDSSKIGFTFWGNMKEAIEKYKDPELKYKMYDALTEYGLYGTMPEEHDDMTLEEQAILSTIQSFTITMNKSNGYIATQQQKSSEGGKARKIEVEQIEEGVRIATRKKKGVPTRAEVVTAIQEEYGISIVERTVTRNCNDARKKEIANEELAKLAFGF